MAGGGFHESEFDGEPEESGHAFDDAGESADLFVFVFDGLDDFGGGSGAFSEADEGVGEGAVGVHGDVAGDVVEDIWFGEVVDFVGFADGDGGGEVSVSEAIEEEVGGDVSADGFSPEAGERVEEFVDVFEEGDLLGVEAEVFDAFEEVDIGVFFPLGEHSVVEGSPGLVVFL